VFIRKISGEDIAQFAAREWRAANADAGIDDAAFATQDIRFVAYLDGSDEPAGYVSGEIARGVCYFRSGITKPAARRKGVMTELVRHMEQVAWEAGCHKIWFKTWEENESMRTLAAQLGYETLAVIPNFELGRTWYLYGKNLG
jgi:RimJ/RimL family protein N-acetyltransferase